MNVRNENIMYLKYFFIVTLFVLVSVESKSEKRRDHRRNSRLFSFNTVDNDIRVDLDFTIPFISIPVKKTFDSAYGLLGFPTININPASLALGSIVVLGAGVVLPFFLKNFALQTDNKYYRLLDNAEFGAGSVFDFAQQMMSDDKGFRGCPLRIACWMGQRHLADPQVVLKQIVSNKLLSTMVNSSAVEDAMASGNYGRDCISYGPCPIQEHHLPVFINKLAVWGNSQDFS